MKKGDLLLVRHNSIIGKLIRAKTGGTYNHIGVFENSDTVIEAKIIMGVSRTLMDVYKKAKEKGKLDYAVYRFKNVSKKKIDGIVAYCAKEVGRKYDWPQLIVLGLYLILGIPRKYEPIDLRHRWLCSELVAEACYSVGIKFSNVIDPDNIAPADIEKSDIVERVL